jgi:DNA (cytosine-5)-methyltransferase 1
MPPIPVLNSVEICAGAGGQALGLESAGYEHASVIEIDTAACATLRANRPAWDVREMDVREISGEEFRGIDLFAGGVPCPPFSIAGKQLGSDDDRDLFPTALRLIEESLPRAILLENVPGLATAKFGDYRRRVASRLVKLGYEVHWQVLNACNFSVPQLRPRFVLVGVRGRAIGNFAWPEPAATPPTVGEALVDLMGSRGWRGASRWSQKARGIGPTIVGGSKKHGGPDLGPTRAREAWRNLGVNGIGVADEPPAADFPIGSFPKLTVRMGARIQGFPDSWEFTGRKTAAWRQVGNAFPPPVAAAVGRSIATALMGIRPTKLPDQLKLALR